jgi:hypothetical protein
MTSPDDTQLPESVHKGRWGVVKGTVRSPAGQPVAGCTVGAHPITPPAEGVPDIAARTTGDGAYELGLPAAIYTLHANGRNAAGVPLHGETARVGVVVGRIVAADITVNEHHD